MPGWRVPDEGSSLSLPPRVCAPCPLVNVRCSESWPFGRLDGLRKGPLDLSLHTTLRIHFTEHVIRVSIMFARRARSRWMSVDEVPSPASSSPVARSIQRCVGPSILSRTGASILMVFESFNAQQAARALPMVPRPPRSVSV